MRFIVIAIIAVFFQYSCGQNNTKQKEPGLKNESQQDSTTKPADPDTAQGHVDSNKTSSISDMVLNIRKEVQRINVLPLDSTKHGFYCDTDGKITYYTYNGKVVKIVIDWSFVGDASSIVEYFYKDGKLIFEYEVIIGAPAGLPDTRLEQRIYVNNDRTIRFMRNQEVIACRKCEFSPSSREYKVLRAYKSGNIKSALCN